MNLYNNYIVFNKNFSIRRVYKSLRIEDNSNGLLLRYEKKRIKIIIAIIIILKSVNFVMHFLNAQ